MDDDALVAPVDRSASEAARRVAAGLVASLRANEPSLLTVAGVDLGEGLEQALFGRLRRLALGVELRPAPRLVHVRSLARLVAATLTLRPAHGPMPGQIVVVMLSPAHESILAPLRGLLERDELPSLFTLHTAHLRQMRGGAGTARLSDMVPRRSLPALLRLEARVASRLRRATTGWSDLVAPDALPFLRGKASELLPRLAVDAAALDAVATRRPALLATLNEVARWSRLLPQVARRHGVPSLDIAHAEAADDIAIRGIGFDRFAVFGAHAARVLERAGVPKERIAEVGAPRFDELVRRHRGNPRMPTARRIVFASQWLNGAMTPAVKRRTLEIALAAAAAAAPVSFVVRLHPLERDSIVEDTLASFVAPGVEVAVERTGTLYGALDGAWLMVTGWSNVVFESLLSNVPAVCINATGGDWPVPFVASGVATGVSDEAGVRAATSRLRDEAQWLAALARSRDAAVDHLGPLDGRAADRLAELIRAMVAGGRRVSPPRRADGGSGGA